ncbi:DNA adenine methylase [Methylobacillus sp. Pita2]|uniref:DNA adenine methylase n=1 Tax=Methylobacillus sp. Pita2 TaxID=3383245 RepID=UPI0038B622FF
MMVSKPALRYHGGKFRLASWVMQFFPAHTCYVEPFGGAAGVLMQKPPAYAEVYNDLDQDMVNFFRVCRDPATRAQLVAACVMTPYARDEFDLAWQPADDPVERARRTVIRAQMGFGSAGATKGKTGFRIDSKRDYGTAMALWAEYPDNIAQVGLRFAGVLIENRDACDVMRQHDAASTLHYVDPPYVFATRQIERGRTYYRHELDDEGHVRLLEALKQLEGYVVLSGYDSVLYREHLAGWEMHYTDSRIAGNRGGKVRTECLWLNPQCSAALRAEAPQQRMFA